MGKSNKPSLDQIFGSKPSLDSIFNDKRPDVGSMQVKPEYNALDSAASGGLQGYVAGFADEGLGALEAGKELLTGKIGLKDLPNAYRRERDNARQAIDGARAANPTVAGVAGFAGSLASPLNKAKGVTQLAALGLGESNADLTKGEILPAATDTLKTVVAGKVVGGLANAGTKLASNVMTKYAPAIGDKLSNATPFVPSGDKASPFTPSIFGKGVKPNAAPPVAPTGPGYGDLAKDFLLGNTYGKTVATVKAGTKFVKENTNVVPQTLNKIADTLKSAPQVYGRFAPALQQAQQKGVAALAAAHFLLSQREPEYRKLNNEE